MNDVLRYILKLLSAILKHSVNSMKNDE